MAASLTTYGTSVATSTLTSAGKLATTIGGSGGIVTMLIGTSTGFGENMALGNASAWAGAVSLFNPSGRGWLWDVSTLANQTLLPGSWTAQIKCKVSLGTITADLYVRVYAYDTVAQTYTLIGTLKLTGQSITTTANTFVLSTTLPAYTFGANQRLYLDYPMNITANATGSGSATFTLNEASTGAQGVANVAQMATPGYSSSGYYLLAHPRPMHHGIGRML